ncbi:hypothetical protein ACFXS9_00605 [Bradyrhizobium sp. RDI18]
MRKIINIARPNGDFAMMKLFAPLLGLAALIAIDLSYAATPAAALGGCGPNRHRSSVTGRCIWGGQNQDGANGIPALGPSARPAAEWFA